jgi:hypothetical protein
MDLQPGPFLQGNVADVAVTGGVYDFTDDAIGLADELNALYHDWDAFMLDLPILAAGPADPTLGIDDVGLIDEIDREATIANFPDIDSLGSALNLGYTLLGAAVTFAPAAAWSTPTSQFSPPDPNATIVVPKIPVSLYTPDVTGLVGQPSTSGGTTISLQNVTRVGQQNFVVGDTALITVQAQPGQQVAWDPIQNGNDRGMAVLGTTGSDGSWKFQGTIGPDQVGQWLENWFVGGKLIATFSFIVVPAGQ